jgi:hypothetical protein
MSAPRVWSGIVAIIALSTLAACADAPTAPRQRQIAPSKPAADLCGGYSLVDGKCLRKLGAELRHCSE